MIRLIYMIMLYTMFLYYAHYNMLINSTIELTIPCLLYHAYLTMLIIPCYIFFPMLYIMSNTPRYI